MNEVDTQRLEGSRLLIVEDDYMIAADLAFQCERLGAKVIGPACSVQDALELIEKYAGDLDGAALDINLNGERVFPVADALIARDIPFIFATGYDKKLIPPAYAQVPRCDKPIDTGVMAKALAAHMERRRTAATKANSRG
jgi:CheY-like chemotaxis protein